MNGRVQTNAFSGDGGWVEPEHVRGAECRILTVREAVVVDEAQVAANLNSVSTPGPGNIVDKVVNGDVLETEPSTL